MSKHTYIIPYYKNKENEILVLIGKKKTYSKKDGFIHNNPDQYILIGGHLQKNINIKENMIKEFEEETGHKIDINKISLLNIKKKDFFIGSYECNSEEYNNFKELSTKERFRELNNIIWVNLKIVKKLIINHNKNINIDILVSNYLNTLYNNLLYFNNKNDYGYLYKNKDINKIKKWYPSRELNIILKKYKNNNLTNKQIFDKFIYPSFMNNNKKIYNDMFNALKKYIQKNSYYDWFIFGIDTFINDINRISNKRIENIPLKSKNSPKFIKGKYIPPHLRSKN